MQWIDQMVERDLREGQHAKKNAHPEMNESASKISVPVQIAYDWNQYSNGHRDGKKMNTSIGSMMQPALSDAICSSGEEKEKAKGRQILGKLAWNFRQHVECCKHVKFNLKKKPVANNASFLKLFCKAFEFDFAP